jgi:hypothetical protein
MKNEKGGEKKKKQNKTKQNKDEKYLNRRKNQR